MRLIKLISIGFLLIFFAGNVLPISISPGKIKENFVPNKEFQKTFYVTGINDMRVSVNVESYITYEMSDIITNENGNRMFNVKFKFPDKIKTPGIVDVGSVRAEEVSSGAGGISVVSTVVAPIYIIVPYPGIYLNVQFNVHNANVNDTVGFVVSVTNLGEEFIKDAYAIIEVFQLLDTGEKSIKQLRTNKADITTNQNADLRAELETVGFMPGEYKAVATLYTNKKITVLENKFNLGELQINILNYTKEFVQGTLSQFSIEVESKWNNRINNVYGAIIINGSSFKTPSIDYLEPWSKAMLNGYLDAKNLSEGEYDVVINVHYNGNIKTMVGRANVVKGVIKEQFAMTTTTWLIAIIIILAIMLIITVIMHLTSKKR